MISVQQKNCQLGAVVRIFNCRPHHMMGSTGASACNYIVFISHRKTHFGHTTVMITGYLLH